MRTIAITGGIGSGKSTVCGLLSSHGVPVYDCDAAAKRLYCQDDSLLDQIEEEFGCGLKRPGGGVDTSKLASLVFPDSAKLKALERIVHPAVLKDFLRWRAVKAARFDAELLTGAFSGSSPFCALESAIILEVPSFLEQVDRVVFVDAPLTTRLRRACERDGASAEMVLQRMSSQRFDISMVDAVILNDGSREKLLAEVSRVFRDL